MEYLFEIEDEVDLKNQTASKCWCTGCTGCTGCWGCSGGCRGCQGTFIVPLPFL